MAGRRAEVEGEGLQNDDPDRLGPITRTFGTIGPHPDVALAGRFESPEDYSAATVEVASGIVPARLRGRIPFAEIDQIRAAVADMVPHDDDGSGFTPQVFQFQVNFDLRRHTPASALLMIGL